jgi:hypothetical protein
LALGAFDQQAANDHKIVGEHRGADEQGEALGDSIKTFKLSQPGNGRRGGIVASM